MHLYTKRIIKFIQRFIRYNLTEKILMSSKVDVSENENDKDNGNMIKELNDFLNKIIDKTKLFEDQMKLLKKSRKFK